MPASISTWSRVHVLAAMFFGTAAGLALAACFNPPSAAVMFSCEADDASACPPGYACESDGCCHREGSDVAADLGACRLGGPGGASTGEPTGPGTGDATAGDATTGPASTTGDAATSDTSTGDTSTGDTSTGDTSTGDTSTGTTGGSSGASSTG